MTKEDTNKLLKLAAFFRSRFFLSLIIGAIILLGLHTGGKVIRPDLLKLLVWLAPALFIVFSVTRSAPDLGWLFRPSLSKAGVVLLSIGILALFGSYTDQHWFYFLEWKVQPGQASPFSQMGLFQFVLLTALLTPFLMHRITFKARWFLLLLVASQILCAAKLLDVTDGQALFRDDHSSFIFRLKEFSLTFPQLINYNPYWNGGSISHYPTSSGTGVIALPLFPLIRLLNPFDFYTYAILAIYIGIIPWIVVGSIRLMGGDRLSALIGGVLALGVSRQFFLWLLHYGTAASGFSMMFLIPILASLYRIFYLDKREWWAGLILMFSVFFLLLWPLGAVAMLPILVTALISIKRLDLKKFLLLIAAGVGFFGLYFKNLWVITHSSQTFRENILEINKPENNVDRWVFNLDILKEGWELLFTWVSSMHPLLLFLGVAGVFFLPSKNKRLWFVPVIVGLLIVAGWGRSYFPDLQLRRMSIPLAIVAIIPAAFWLTRILSSHGPYMAVIRAAAIALLISGSLTTAKLYENKGPAPYQVLPQYIKDLGAYLQENTEKNDRIIFIGRTVHKYGWGHVASLPMLTGREMMATDYYHFSPKKVEYDYPPRTFRAMKDQDGYLLYMDLYNASHCITYHKNYIDYFNQRPETYTLVKTVEGKNINVYKVNRPSNIFLKGTGTVEAEFNRIQIHLDQDQEEVIIKYNWLEELEADGPVEIFPHVVHPEVTLLGLRPKGAKTITLRYKSRI